MPRVNSQALKAMITMSGFSIVEFAREANMTPSHVSNVIAGRRGCSPSTIKRMAEVLQVPMQALLKNPEAVA